LLHPLPILRYTSRIPLDGKGKHRKAYGYEA